MAEAKDREVESPSSAPVLRGEWCWGRKVKRNRTESMNVDASLTRSLSGLAKGSSAVGHRSLSRPCSTIAQNLERKI